MIKLNKNHILKDGMKRKNTHIKKYYLKKIKKEPKKPKSLLQ